MSAELKTTGRFDEWLLKRGTLRGHMKILFLDVDGVLTFDDGSGSLDPAKLAALSGIVERVPDLHICISSSLACCGRLTFGGGYHTAPPPLPFQALGLAALPP